jgi:cell fate (sporulation/competence/biofilm development) regulator YlbF (YheA/YmcA/DUF963 family)
MVRFPRIFCWVVMGCLAASAAEIPVTNIVLYKHGVGYFERTGSLAAGQEARLDFKTSDMNDVLKSLTVTDRAGLRVSGIRYDSNESLDQRLQDFPFQIGPGEQLSAFLDALRGARLELKTKEGTQAGSIVGARSLRTEKTTEEHVTLLLDSGEMANFDLAQISSFKLSDAALQQKLKDYLAIVAKANAKDKRSVYIDSASAGARDLKVAYVAPVAIWKSSYRLTLADAKSNLEGWAIVDNTTDEDWNNVGLSVVSGRPISFISLLDTPRFGNRQVAELPEDRAAGPEVYGGTVSADTMAGVAGFVGGAISGAPAPPPARMQSSKMRAPSPVAKSEASTVQGATGATLGELFEYNFAGPVTIKRNQSAMLPFLQDKIAARKLLIYKETDGEHPVNAAEVTNTSGKTLDGGPITVYDAGAYAGESLVETFKAGDKRLIGYAVDYGTRVTTGFESGSENVLEIHAAHGVLEIKSAVRDTKTYEVKNVDPKLKTLIVEQPVQSQYKMISPKPTERTAGAYRFEVQVAANGGQTLKVEQERVNSETVAISGSTPDYLLNIVSGRKLSDAGRTQLEAIIALKRKIASAQSAMEAGTSAMDELTQDQTRLRQNIDSLNKVIGQEDKVRQYSTRLNDNEVKLADMRDKQNTLKQTVSDLNSQISEALEKLRF